ncbi:hypothetical protein KBTX_04412 [wastewater metagenome]|uniref:Uncharacterized protein n=2 Tax=unclassified sequences TaxID=12908 RepID=A0A5B8RK85_9ZZZZ|nr:hypothetical protein KBTEX_04412 [uncultured organism]
MNRANAASVAVSTGSTSSATTGPSSVPTIGTPAGSRPGRRQPTVRQGAPAGTAAATRRLKSPTNPRSLPTARVTGVPASGRSTPP